MIDRWCEAWTDGSLDELLAYETGRVLGEAALSAVYDDARTGSWVLAQLLETRPQNATQRALHSGLVDAVTEALWRLAVERRESGSSPCA